MKLSLIKKTLQIRNGLLKSRAFSFATKNLKVPSIAESIEEATVVRYLKKEGEYVNQDDEILEVETHKGNFNIRSPEAGKVVKYLVELDTDVDIGADFVELDLDATPEQSTPSKPEAKEEPVKAPEAPKKEEAKPEAPKKEEAKPQTPKPQQPVQNTTKSTERTETREKMSRLRKTVAKRLKESQTTYAQVTTFQELDMGEVMRIRKELGEEFMKRHGVKLGFMSFFIKAVTQALKERPIVNSVIDDKTEEIVHRSFVDISVAVSSPKGLVVPILRDCQSLGFAEIEQGLIEMATKAKENKLSIEDMSGGTFTISNGGVFGSMLSAPIINPPQSAILGMHNIVNRPVVRKGEIVARPIMYLSLSYDHRLLDGREGASYLKRISELLEDPRRLLLEQ